MALLNAVVLQSKEVKGGKNKVRISVAHNGETRYIVTDIIINSPKEFKNGSVVKRPDATLLNAKIRGLLQRYQSILDDLGYIDGVTCPELVCLLKTGCRYNNRTIKSIYEEYIERSNIKDSSVSIYRYLWNGLSKYLGDDMRAEQVNHGTILGLDKYLRTRGCKSMTIRNYLLFFMSILSYATRCGYVQFRINPFFGYHLPETEIRQAWVSVEGIRRIRDLKTSKPNIVKCRDLFMLSYYLGGINITDMLDINFNEQSDIIHYVRKKTNRRSKINKFVEFCIPDEAKAIISRLKGSDGKISVPDRQRRTCMRSFFEYNMQALAKLTGIDNLVYYSARKSFSQHAFDLGVETSVIDYILGHKVDKKSTSLYNYIFVTPEMATMAVRKVLDNLK